MTTVSNFEVLLQPIVPASKSGNDPVPTAIQAYFLLISRLIGDGVSGDITLQISFFPSTPFNADQLIITFEDGDGNNGVITPFTASPTFSIAPGKTILVGLQPNLSQPNILNANFAFRGYVDISLQATKAAQSTQLLLSPQIRSTFLPSGEPPAQITAKDFTELAYSLITPNGGGLFMLSASVIKDKEKEATKDNKDGKDRKDRKDNKENLKDKEGKENLKEKEILETLPQTNATQQLLQMMAERLDNLEQQLGTGQPFIRSEERPPVGEVQPNLPGN